MDLCALILARWSLTRSSLTNRKSSFTQTLPLLSRVLCILCCVIPQKWSLWLCEQAQGYVLSTASGKHFGCKEKDIYIYILLLFFYKKGWWGTGIGCLEMWWMSHTWRHSVSGWTGLWVTWSRFRCPCSSQRSWTKWHCGVPSNTNSSMILWWIEHLFHCL